MSDEFSPRQWVLIAFLGGLAFAAGAGVGGALIWWLITITDGVP